MAYNGLTLWRGSRLGEEMVTLSPNCQIYPIYSLLVRETESTVVIDDQAVITPYIEQRLNESEKVM